MASKVLIICLLTLYVINAVNSEEDRLQAYTLLQENIQKFLDNEWASLTNSVRSSPQLSQETSLMEAFNVMLSPMLVPANGKREHAEAMSAFCYNYFQAGMDMTKDHIKKDVYLSGDTSFINQLTEATDRMKQLQGQCISTLGSSLFGGIVHYVSDLFKGIIHF